jgi:selenide,water dikinase
VLAGGGHAHALMLRQWGKRLPRDVRFTLVSPDALTPYSGMLPGLIAGHYAFEEIHIDLELLCRWAGVSFCKDRVVGLDATKKVLLLANGAQLNYDLLSLDTGSVPHQSVSGVSEHAVAVKPISEFWQRWQDVKSALLTATSTRRLAVVGGGAGAVEIGLALAHACHHLPGVTTNIRFALLSASHELLPGYPEKIRQAVRQACARAGIELFEGSRVTEVGADYLRTDDGHQLPANHVFWCTQAAAPAWPKAGGLACDRDGFVSVNRYLQSVSHDSVFVTGDLADMKESPRPKAGVFAVRQAPILKSNLLSGLNASPMKPFNPQHEFLSLLTLGAKKAAGGRGIFTFSGHLTWWWKNRIDQNFMTQFRELP